MRNYLQHGRRHAPDGSDPIIGGLRQVFGGLDGSGGDPNPGSNDWSFTGGYNDDSSWIITYTTPFGAVPIVVATETDTGLADPGNFVQVCDESESGFTIKTWDGTSRTEIFTVGFNFLAIGTA